MSPRTNPAAPPTTPGALERPPVRSHHLVVGILLIVIGSLSIIAAGFQAFSVTMQARNFGFPAQSAIRRHLPLQLTVEAMHVLVGLLGVTAGVLLINRHRIARRFLHGWVWSKLLFAMIGGVVTYVAMNAMMSAFAQSPMAGSPAYVWGLSFMQVAIKVCIAVVPPILLLIWMRSKNARRLFEEWKA